MTRRDLFKRAMGMLAAVPCLGWLGEPKQEAITWTFPKAQGGQVIGYAYTVNGFCHPDGSWTLEGISNEREIYA